MIHKIIVGVVLNSLALYLVTKFLPDIEFTGGLKFFILGGAIIGSLNTFVKPIMKLLSLPFILVTAGLFTLVINTIIFWATMKSFELIQVSDITVAINDPLVYLWGALIFGLVNWALHLIINNK